MDSSFNLAVHALVCLSHSGRSLSSEALAENICTNPTRVRRVLAGLKKAGMVETREGLDGGYRLTADPATLSLRQVAEAVNTRFVDCAWHSGDIDRDCAICSGMAGVMDALNRYTADLAAEQIRLAFAQAQKEVDDLHQRTREGLMTARLNGRQIGQVPGRKLHVKKAAAAKELILKHSRDFNGTLADTDCIKLIGIARNTYYKYKRELRDGTA